MVLTIVEFFRKIFAGNDFLTLYVISMIPVVELRGAILFMPAMFFKGTAETFGEMYLGMWCCIAGSTTVILPLMLLTRPLLKKLKGTRIFAKFAKNMEAELSDRAEKTYSGAKQCKIRATCGKKQKRVYGADIKKFCGLFAFVAVPLPMTGAWTGSCVGSFLDIPVWKAALAVFFGNIVAGHILMAAAWLLPGEYADIFLVGFAALAIATASVLAYLRVRLKKEKTADERDL